MDKTARLFFALWPEPEVRGALDQAGRKLGLACGGRRMRAPNLHLTLVFLGSVALERIAALRDLANQVSAEPFVMKLDRLGWWKHNRVAWAAPEIIPDPLLALVGQLQAGLRQAAFSFDDRPTFSPHITLLRNARCTDIAWPPFRAVEWKAGEFVLVRSVTREDGAAYEIIGRWALRSQR